MRDANARRRFTVSTDQEAVAGDAVVARDTDPPDLAMQSTFVAGTTHRPRRVFVQFLNPEILALYGIRPRLSGHALVRAVMPLTRLGLLVGEEGLVMPFTYLTEVPEIDDWLKKLGAATSRGLVGVAGASPSGADLVVKKRQEYRAELELFPAYKQDGPLPELGDLQWIPRVERSSSDDIAIEWTEELRDGGLWQRLIGEGAKKGINRLPSRLDESVGAVPERLKGQAFITRYALPLMGVELGAAGRTQTAMLISRAYLRSYLLELDAVVLADTGMGRLDCGLEGAADAHARTVSTRRFRELLQTIGVRAHIEHRLTLPRLLALREEPVWHWFVNAALTDTVDDGRPLLGAVLASGISFEQLSGRDLHKDVRDRLLRVREAVTREDLPEQLQLGATVRLDRPTVESPVRRRIKSRLMAGQAQLTDAYRGQDRDVFLVCGRDERAISAMKALLAAADIHVVEWEEACRWTGRGAPYVLEVLQCAFGNVGKVLVLLTPDDEVQLREDLVRDDDPAHEKSSGGQARPNVLIEAGMALALHPDRTVIVEIGQMRPMTDLEGVHVLRFKGTAKDRADLLGRLHLAPPRSNDYLATPGFEFLE